MQARQDEMPVARCDRSDTITILHFNDVYNVESREVEPVGGAARWVFKYLTFSVPLIWAATGHP